MSTDETAPAGPVCARELLSWLAASRATRAYSARPVDPAVIDELLEVARWTGSSRNRQPWHFVVVHNREVREQLAGHGGYAQHLVDAPVVIALAGDPSTGGTDTEFDMGRACQALVLAAHAHGLGTCPATLYPDVRAGQAARLLGLAHPWRVHHVVAVGHPTAPTLTGRAALAAGRRPLDDLTTHVV